MIDIWSDIWVGNWLDKVKEQNKLLSGQKATSLTPNEKVIWSNFEKQGRIQFDKFHPGETWNSAQGAAYFANTYILQQRAAKKSAATKSAAASAGASDAASSKQAAAAENRSAALKEAAASAGASAAAAERQKAVQRELQKIRSAKAYDALKETVESASRAGASAERAKISYESKMASDAAQKKAAEDQRQAEHDYEQLLIDNAKLQAQLQQSQGTIDQLREQGQQVIYYNTDTGTTPYYSSGDNMDNNVTLEPVAVQGTNLRNSLLLVGGVALVWYLLKRKKRR